MTFVEFNTEVEKYKTENAILFQLDSDCIVGEDDINSCEKHYGIELPESYKQLLKKYGGGYFGYAVFYSLDKEGSFCLYDYISDDEIKEYNMLPVIDLETGDYIGFNIENNKCTEDMYLWMHEEKKRKRIMEDFFEVLIDVGIKNKPIN